MNHTKQCTEQLEMFAAAKARFEDAYPNHCKACRGYGGSEYQYDPSPAGVSLGSGSMCDFDTCTECTDKGICSLCAGKTDDDGNCITTGCDMAKDHPGDGPECYCYEIEALNPTLGYPEQAEGSAHE